MKRIVTLFLSLVLLLSCLCAPASALFDPSLFYEVQARSAYIVNTDTNIIVYDKDSQKQVPAGGLTKYMTIALVIPFREKRQDAAYSQFGIMQEGYFRVSPYTRLTAVAWYQKNHRNLPQPLGVVNRS